MSENKTRRPEITVSTADLDRLEGLLGELRASTHLADDPGSTMVKS